VLNRLGVRLDRLSSIRLFFAVLIPLFAIYLATATVRLPYHIDAFTNALTAWHIADHGSIYLDESPDLASPDNFASTGLFTTTSDGHIVSQYPPGAALVAVPFYLLDRSSIRLPMYGSNKPNAPPVTIDVPSLVPASAAASLATALAVALLALVFLPFLSPSRAIIGAYVAGLGTGAWSVASNALWQHGPAMLWIALALYLVSRGHRVWGGLAFGLAILTRPHIALIAAAVGIAVGLTKRSFKPVLAVGSGSLLGLLALVGYNWAVFGSMSISGGYGPVFAERAANSSLSWYLKNIAGALVDPIHGLLIWAPFLILLIPGLAKGWKSTPSWAKGAAIGGLLYLLLQLKANRFSGGDGFLGYRYPLEALVAAAPLLVISWKEWIANRPFRTRLFSASVVLSIALQTIGAIQT
jgi:hypothetical protein